MSDVDIELDRCLWNLIQLRKEDRCEYVIENCEQGSIINFYHIYFCSLKESNLLFLPISVS
jgi:hypothetical protein